MSSAKTENMIDRAVINGIQRMADEYDVRHWDESRSVDRGLLDFSAVEIPDDWDEIVRLADQFLKNASDVYKEFFITSFNLHGLISALRLVAVEEIKYLATMKFQTEWTNVVRQAKDLPAGFDVSIGQKTVQNISSKNWPDRAEKIEAVTQLVPGFYLGAKRPLA